MSDTMPPNPPNEPRPGEKTGPPDPPNDEAEGSDQLFAEYLRQVDEGGTVDFRALQQHEQGQEIVDLIKTSEQIEEMAGPRVDETMVGSEETITYVRSEDLANYFTSTEFEQFEPIEFGDYELLEVIGRGGMGVVFRAQQRSLGRIVAVKMILAGPLARDDDVKRFQAEMQAAGNLDHPFIVTIFHAGREHGRDYFSMEYVEGVELGEYTQREWLDDHRIARITSQISDAIHTAHDAGILHRDLKPGNVLIDSEGRPRITDFGLAKLQTSDQDLTESGQTLGTPSYMSPEQASGNVKTMTSASDVYSIGAVMYYMMVGEPPFRRENVVDTIMDVMHKEPRPPRRMSSGRSKELEAICLKCLAKDPARRYDTAQALADDLRRFQRGEPTVARPAGWIRHSLHWMTGIPLVSRVLGRQYHSVSRTHRLVNWFILLLPLIVFASVLVWRWSYHQTIPSEIVIYTAQRDGSSYPTGNVFERLMEETWTESACQVEVVATQGSQENRDLLSDVGRWSLTGHMGILQQEALPKDGTVQPLAPLFREYVFFLVRQDSPAQIDRWQPPVALGEPKSGRLLTSRDMIETLRLRAIDPADVRNQVHADVAVLNADYNAAIVTTGSKSPIVRRMLDNGFKLMPLTREQMSQLDEWGIGEIAYPAEDFVDFKEEQPANAEQSSRFYQTLTTTTYLAARENCRHRLVRETMHLMYDNIDAFQHPQIISRERARAKVSHLPFHYHPEARRYFESIE